MILFCALFSKLMIIGVTPHVKLNRKYDQCGVLCFC
jgi:hypothetical protein